ncbi:MAG: 3-phosphoserine/phosphohydroxythreonine transaminase [Anaerolineales bacterium]|nr:3-phosphoserine/phosphohydroxythreonine transaminase [Chloroflexota bacterium]MBL6983111.1 3-phosphoserine/phosphohydroxythreonine transaminase [Anaerolineales bacterium]
MRLPVHNFNAGPTVLPKAVLQKVQAELMDYLGTGMSIMEMSHRSTVFDDLMVKVDGDLRRLLEIPQNYKTLFLQGGASLQFSMVPMNLLPLDGSADYIVNGVWGEKAVKEAQKVGSVHLVASTKRQNFDRVPERDLMSFDSHAGYVHFTSNETIQGVQWPMEPDVPAEIPLICDMSSDILSRPIDVSKYGLIYAGAQKNAGPAGVTMVIIREDLLGSVPNDLATMLDYRLQAEKKSLINTPPSFAIYVLGLVLGWLLDLGGLPAISRLNQQKAILLYDVIDTSEGFYRGHAQSDSRSLMNVTFRLETTELEESFAKEALAQGMVGLKGHRSVGGLRASIYNACPLESVETLATFMKDFQGKYA